MKSLLPTCFLPLAVFLFLHTGTSLHLEKPDTLIIHATGINNNVVIDSLQLNGIFSDVTSFGVKGEITQTGENNRIDIQIPNSKKQITNKHQKTNNKNQAGSAEHGTCNMKRATIKIKQTGKNNSVKINSR